MIRLVLCCCLFAALIGCGPGTVPFLQTGTGFVTQGNVQLPDGGDPMNEDAGTRLAPEIGTGDHLAGSVTFTVIAAGAQGLRHPRDLDFNPMRPDELWAISLDDDSVLVVFDASKDTRRTERRKDAYALHFMEKASSMDFGANATTIGKEGTFGTCQESRNTYDDQAPPNDFMGPALWSSDLSVFAMSDPIGLGAHLDMLHGSPNCMGIAHEKDNIYWVFGGKAQTGTGSARQVPIPAIVKVNFNLDHGIGLDDHSDGEIYQYAENQVKDVPGVPSHMVFDQATKLLYIADTGNKRIVKFDTLSGTRGAALTPMEPMRAYYRMEGTNVVDVVPASAALLDLPSGLELHNDLLYVSDTANGRIVAFNLEGQMVNYLVTGLPAGALAGMTFGPDGKLYFVDQLNDQILRIDPK